MATWLLVGLVYLSLVGVFLVAWSRGFPQPENSSRAIQRFERWRLVQSILAHAFQAQHRSNGKFISLLKELDASAKKSRMRRLATAIAQSAGRSVAYLLDDAQQSVSRIRLGEEFGLPRHLGSRRVYLSGHDNNVDVWVSPSDDPSQR